MGRIAILGGQGSSKKKWEVPERDSCDSNSHLHRSPFDLKRRRLQQSWRQGL